MKGIAAGARWVCCLAAFLGCSGLPAVFSRRSVTADGKPIPGGPEARTSAVDRDVRIAWGRKHLLDGYGTVGRHDPRWDAPARRLIEASITAMLGNTVEPPPGERIADGRAAVAAGCDDPLVLYLLGRTIYTADALSGEPEELFRRAAEGMKAVRYDRAVARLPAAALHALHALYDERRESLGLRPPVAALEMQWFRESLADGSYGPDDDVVLMWQLRYGVGKGFVTRAGAAVPEALAAAPWVDPWVRLYFSGLRHHHAAWEARGNGFASEVSAAQWTAFGEASGKARRDLEESYRLRPDRPEAAFAMIAVLTGAPKDGEDERFWFDRTVAAQMDFVDAYETLWLRTMPRWGGTYEQAVALGREALATRRFDTEVPAQLFWILRQIRRDQASAAGGGGQPVFERPETMALLRTMFEGYLAEPSRAAERARWESLWAVAADYAGDTAESARHLEAAGDRLHPQAIASLERDETPEAFVRRVVLRTSAAAAEVTRAAARAERFDVEAALEAYREAMQKDASPRVAAVLRHEQSALEMERALGKGEWVPFLPASDDLAGWRPLLGTWTREPDGALVAFAGSRGYLIVSDARVGPNFEVRGRMELVSSTNAYFQGGVAFGRPSWDSQEWVSLRIKRTAHEGPCAYFSQHLYEPEMEPVRMPIPDQNAFTLRVRGGRLSATVNGVVVQQEGAPPSKGLVTTPDSRVGFGGYVDENLVRMRFRNVEIRRLPSGS
jgi:tetratricopeptide (TPR) repeat protein